MNLGEGMPNGRAFVYVFDGFADWEPASALAELRRTFGFSVHTFALTKSPVVSMGGLRIVPDQLIAEAEPSQIDIAILPGGDAWMRGEIPEITQFVKALAAAGRPVAAICAATLALAHAELLDDRRHTSNGAGFISKSVPGYRGQHLYQKARAVTDRNIITANGLAPFAFASEIFRAVAPNRAEEIAAYDRLYSRGLLDD
jgi:putative intracellular protease/amidase